MAAVASAYMPIVYRLCTGSMVSIFESRTANSLPAARTLEVVGPVYGQPPPPPRSGATAQVSLIRPTALLVT